MKQISNFYKDTQTPKPVPGSYEWWYFDAMSVDGYSVVIIFYEGNPFSRRYIKSMDHGNSSAGMADQFPAITVSVYKDGRHIFYSFEEVDPDNARFSAQTPEVTIGMNSLKGVKEAGSIRYRVHLDQRLINGDRITGNLEFLSLNDTVKNPFEYESETQNESGPCEPHTWNLIQPRAAVSGELNISGYRDLEIDFSGTGYHDHNLGFEPMKESFEEWYWGRYHFQNYTLIYYLMKGKGEWEKKAWLIGEDGMNLPVESISMKEKGLNMFGLHTARIIEFQGIGFNIHLQKDIIADNGPFYQRFIGRALMKTSKTVIQTRGISEYIRPGRIYNRIFWPLVDMRITYPGKSHWVQRSPVFYRWTW